VPQTNVIIEIRLVLLFAQGLYIRIRVCIYRSWFTLYNTTEELIFYADQIMVMGSSKNLPLFNFAILLK